MSESIRLSGFIPPRVAIAELRELLSYDPATGIFRWNMPRHKSRGAGAIAGSADRGYHWVTICKKRYGAGPLAWFYMTGVWPAVFIDHIDGNGLNNAFSNLREADRAQNGRNRKGARGVKFDKRFNRFYAYISVNNKNIHLGTFLSEGEARAAYVAATKKYFGEFSAFLSRRAA